jgi:hypothetical protein
MNVEASMSRAALASRLVFNEASREVWFTANTALYSGWRARTTHVAQPLEKRLSSRVDTPREEGVLRVRGRSLREE